MLKTAIPFTAMKAKIYHRSLDYIYKRAQLHLSYQLYSSTRQVEKVGAKETQQRAIVSMHTINFIGKTRKEDFLKDNRSIRQRILDLQHLSKIILAKSSQFNKSTTKRQMKDISIAERYSLLQEAGLQRSNIKKILEGYEVSNGAECNLRIWVQSRFEDALSPNKKMLLMPTIGCAQIFNIILNPPSRCIIYGDKCAGKSFAYFNYDYLSKFVIDYQIYLSDHQQSPSNKFLSFITQKQLKKVKKLFYFPLRIIQFPLHLQNIFQQQTHINNRKKLDGTQKDEDQQTIKVGKFLALINTFYFERQIGTICVVDQANAYLSQFRQLIRYQLTGNTNINKYSLLLKCVQHQFTCLFYNCSKAIQEKKVSSIIENIRDKYGRKYLEPFPHQKHPQKFHINYFQQFSIQQGHISLYSFFFDQFCKNFQQCDLENNHFFRSIFLDTFGIPYQSLKPQKFFIWWQNDIKPVNINLALKKLKEKEGDNIRKLILSLTCPQKVTSQEIMRMSAIFKNIKKLIEQNRQVLFENSIKGYYIKSADNIFKSFRFQILIKIDHIRSSQEIRETDCPLIEVDFKDQLNRFQSDYSSKDFYQQVTNLPSLIGAGNPIIVQTSLKTLNQNVMNTKFQFSLTSKSTSEIIRFVSLNLDEVKLHIRQFTSKRACCPVIAGVLMDLLYFHLFQASKIKILLPFAKGDILKKITFNVDQLRPFNVIESVDKMKMWEQLQYHIFQAITYQKVVLGFQATMQKSKKLSLNHKNPIFDFVIIKSMNEFLQIWSFDVTVDQINTKISDFLKKESAKVLSKQIQSISQSFKTQVKWSHMILAPNYQYQKFDEIDHKDHDQAVFSNGGINSIIKDQTTKYGQLRLGLAIQSDKQYFQLPQNQKGLENSILKQMKCIISRLQQLEILKKYAAQKQHRIK